MFNKNIEIGFKRENRQSTSYNFNFFQYYVQFLVLPDVMGE